MPAGWPEPCVGNHVSPSSSVNDNSLVMPFNCDENVRFAPPRRPSSVKRIGSRLTRANGERLSSHAAVAGFTASLNVTRSVWLPAPMNTLPVRQFTPIDGSPASCPPALVEPIAGTMQFDGGVDPAGTVDGQSCGAE